MDESAFDITDVSNVALGFTQYEGCITVKVKTNSISFKGYCIDTEDHNYCPTERERKKLKKKT